jgi:GT2 family glycosyltransferase
LFLRSALQQIGWADEDTYDFYKADGDMSLRLWEAGYEIVDCPGAFMEHYFDPEEEKRVANSATMQKDRAAYSTRWSQLLQGNEPTRSMGKLTLSFQDPDETVKRWVAASARRHAF